MHKRIQISLFILVISITISTLFSPLPTSYGENQTEISHSLGTNVEDYDDEIKDILQSSLSIVEIDREIGRLEVRLLELEEQLDLLDLELTEQELLLVEKKEAAGQVLRSYFIGDRTEMLFALLNSRSLDTFLRKLEFFELIMKRDQRILTSFKEQQTLLEQQYAAYIAEQVKIEQTTFALQTKRTEIVKLEQDIDDKLANRTDSEKILLLMEALTNKWNEDGIEKIEHYLYLLNDAMLNFPTWLQQQTEYTKLKGLSYYVELPEDALNTFLREQHPDFESFSFSFSNGQIIAKGKDDDMAIELTGRYTIINEPRHYIQFSIDSLYFNSFALPQSTIDDLMSKYDLNFYPGLIVSFLQATSVELSDGYLNIQLKLKL